ncbi:hypothetical protein J1N35_001713 [Gossypium stocksii]|uniref:DUF4283 domain-containing protein n=1 Tax=Gossypium stocksii TaxID=47602 RepID=A0A9D4AJV8_9ROSI|nr:hypothetical protein J1N35_001713 [Gossypium stocksii]
MHNHSPVMTGSFKDFAGLTLDQEEEAVLQVQVGSNTNGEMGGFRLVGCFLTSSIVHFPAMKSTMANLRHPIWGVQIRDLGEKSDSFCEAIMALGVEVAEIGWDLSLRAQSRRALMMTSVWLREEGEGEWAEITRERWVFIPWKEGGNLSGSHIHTLLEHDLEDGVLVGEEGIVGELPRMVCGDFNEILYGFEKRVVYLEKKEE